MVHWVLFMSQEAFSDDVSGKLRLAVLRQIFWPLAFVLLSGLGLIWFSVRQKDTRMRDNIEFRFQFVARTFLEMTDDRLLQEESDKKAQVRTEVRSQLHVILHMDERFSGITLYSKSADGQVVLEGCSHPEHASIAGTLLHDEMEQHGDVPHDALEPTWYRTGAGNDPHIRLLVPHMQYQAAKGGSAQIAKSHSRLMLEVSIPLSVWRMEVLSAAYPPAILLLCMLVFIFIGGSISIRQREKSLLHSPRLPVFTAIASGMIALYGVYLAVDYGQNVRHEVFSHLSIEKAASLNEFLKDVCLMESESLAKYVEAMQELGKDPSLTDFAGHLGRYHYVMVWGEASVVPATNRVSFQQSLEERIGSDFRIWEVEEDGQQIPARERPLHYVITAGVPPESSSHVIGFDMASEAQRRATIEAALASDTLRWVGPLDIHGPDGLSPGLLLIRPVAPPPQAGQYRKFIILAVRGIDIIRNLNPGHKMDLRLLVGEQQKLLSQYGSMLAPMGRVFRYPVPFYGKRFILEVSPSETFFIQYPLHAGWFALIAGTVIVFSLTFAAMSITRRHRQLHQLVEKRTSELMETEKHLRRVFSKIDSIAVQGYAPDGTVCYWNRGSEKLYGYASEEAFGQNLLDLIIPSEMRSDVQAHIHQMFESGQAGPAEELELVRKDGSRVAVYSSHVISRYADGTAELYCIDVDVSRQKEVADALRKAKEQADAASESKSRFLANMSHELRTPLNGVIGMIRLLMDTDLTAEQRRFSKMLDSSSHALLSVINDVLDFSKIEAGKLSLQPDVYAVRNVLRDTVGLLSQRAMDKDLALTYHVDENVPQNLVIDGGRVYQILINLVTNAIKFTERGHVKITFDWESCESREATSEGTLVFCVEDTGIGIAAGKLQKLFEAFEQSDNSFTRRYGGTGLGLTICKQLIELMDGSIAVDSREGRGSTFTCRIPCRVAHGTPAPAPEKTTGSTLPFDGLKVLLAEDNVVNQEVARIMLSQRGAAVTVVDNGQDARNRALTESFDLLFMDIQMPVMDGLEATRQIREAEKAGDTHLPIVAMTAHVFVRDRERCIAAGMDDYISKPIEPRVVDAVLFKWVAALKKSESTQDPGSGHTGIAGDRQVWDREGFANRMMHNEELMKKVCATAKELLPPQIHDLRHAIETQNMEISQQLAHDIKGSASNLGAARLQEVAAQITNRLRDELPVQKALLDQLEKAGEDLIPCLEKEI